MRAETFLSIFLCWGLSLAPRQLLPWETGCQQAWPWPHHPLCGVCLAEVISGIAPQILQIVDLQANSLFCEVLFAHIALPGAGCGYRSGKLEPRTMGFGNHSGENAAPGEQGEAGPERRFGLLGRAGEACCQQRGVLPHLALDPAWPFPTHWEPGKLDCVSFPCQVTKNQLAIL